MALEELARPLNVIDTLFAQHVAQAGGTPAAQFGERAHFQKALGFDNEEALAKIPCLNDVECADSIPPFSLVRYRCLVQDVFEPEFYASTFQEVDDKGGAARLVTSKYRECIEPAAGRQLQELDNYGSLSQRGAVYCVPMPGERAWARSAAAEWTAAGGGQVQSAPVASAASGAGKRRRDDDVSMEPQDDASAQPPVTAARTGYESVSAPQAPTAGGKDLVLGASSGPVLKTAEDFGLNFPIPSEERRGCGASTACIVKLYDDDADKLRVCDTIEVIGVLCVNPDIASLPDAETGNMGDDPSMRDARHPSTSLIPRLHALAVRALPFHSPLLPFSPDWLSEDRLAAVFQRQFAAPGSMLAARTAAVQQLTKHLAGDALAAEYLFMLLVARSFSKHGEKLLGTWSLNVAGWPASMDSKVLRDAAGELVPRAVNLEVTNDTLNTQKWRPQKDFVANRLVAGQLQLSAGTLLMLDETKMAEGQLTADGVKSLLAMQQLVTENKLACDFMSYDVKIPLELSCVVLSGRKSLVKDIDVLVPLRVQQEAAGAVAPEGIAAARWMLALVTRSPRALKIPDEVMHVFGEDFAAARQEFKVKPELAHTWMALARARCLTFGEEELSLQRWREVMELERTRLVRCREDGMADA